MTEFNVYNWKDDLMDEIIERIKDEQITDDDEMRNFIHNEIDTACIYYSDCLGIIEATGAYDFSRFDIECTTIPEVAYCALLEETYDFDFDEIKNETQND
tara:strand:- start:134 stop:433 length:300 start_codon:yes stop_codon:yes gene_type:complete